MNQAKLDQLLQAVAAQVAALRAAPGMAAAAPLAALEDSLAALRVACATPGGLPPAAAADSAGYLAVAEPAVAPARRAVASESQYRLLFQHNPQPMWVYDLASLRFLAVNAAAIECYGYTEQEFLALHSAELGVHDPPAAAGAQGVARHHAGPRHRRRDGSVIEVELSADDIHFDGRPARLVLVQDVTERNRASRELARKNRALHMLSACTEAMLRADSEQALLDATCRIAVDVGGYALAWVGFAQDDEQRAIVPVAQVGEEDGFLQSVPFSWSASEPGGQGPAGRTIRSGSVAVVEDSTLEPAFGPFASRLQQRGYRSVVCLPLRNRLRTFGLFYLYASEPVSASSDEVPLLQQLADDLAFGIEHLRNRLERQRMQAAVVKLAAGVSGGSGAAFFEQLARNMAEALGAQQACVARLLPEDPPRAHTLALVGGRRLLENFEFELAGTPVQALQLTGSEIVADRLPERYPQFVRRAGGAPRAFAGRRLDGADGRPLGMLFVLFAEPLAETEFIVSTLRIFATRAAAEIERAEIDARLREQASLLDQAQDAIIVRDTDDRVLFWNQGAERLYGWTAGQARGRPLEQLIYADPAALRAATRRVLEQGEWTGELLQHHQDGQALTIEGRWTLLRDAQGEARSILSIHTDISRRKRAEQLDAGQRAILAGVAARRPLGESLAAATRLFELQYPQALCSILLLDEGGTRLRLGAAASLPEAYNQAIDGIAIGEGVGSCGTAAWRGEPVVVTDIASDPLWRPYAELARHHGLRACWSTPVKRVDGRIVAVFAIYWRQVRGPDAAERRAVDDIVALVGIAIEQAAVFRSLERSEQRFRSLFDHNPEAVYSTDLDGRIVSANASFARLTGLALEQVIGLPFEQLVARTERERVRAHFDAALGGRAQHYAAAGRRPDQGWVETLVNVVPTIVEGEVEGVFGIITDVTALNRAQRDLQAALLRAERQSRQMRQLSETALMANVRAQDAELPRLLAEALRDTIGCHMAVLTLAQGKDWSKARNTVSLSEKYARWRGYKLERDGSGIYAMVAERNQPMRLTQAALEAHPRWRNFGRSASEHPPLRGWLAVPLIGNDGRNIGLFQLSDRYEGDFSAEDEAVAVQFAHMIAVSLERGRMLGQLQERNRFFQLSQEMFCIGRPDGHLVQVNAAFTRVLGWSSHKLTRTPWIDLVHPDDRAAALAQAAAVASGVPVPELVNRYRHRDGSYRWLEWSSIRGPDGLIYAVARDISRRHLAERKLERSLAELRTRNLELQDFAFIASHDLQEPLRKVRAFADRLLSRCVGQLDPQGIDYLHRMTNAATRMQTLIDDLLAYSRVLSQTRPFVRVDLNQVLQEVLIDLEERIHESRGRIEAPALPTLWGDPTQLGQVLQNLIGNALKYRAAERDPVVRLQVVADRLNDAPAWQIRFCDNGIGFADEFRERIFVPFQRLHGRGEYAGTGIGLAIVRRIVERHGGVVSASGRSGEGAVFELRLPVQPPGHLLQDGQDESAPGSAAPALPQPR